MSSRDYERNNRSDEKVSTNFALHFWKANPLFGNREGSLHGFLKSVNVLKGFSDLELYTFSKYLHLRRYEKNEVVFKEGDRGFGFYLIYTGSVKIYTANEKGEQSYITTLDKHDFFGELSLLEQSATRSATVLAGVDTSLLALYIPDFEEILNTKPLVGAKVLKALSIITSRRFLAVTKELKTLKHKVKEYEALIGEKK